MERKGRKLSRRFALWLMALLVAAACTFTGCSGTADGGSDELWPGKGCCDGAELCRRDDSRRYQADKDDIHRHKLCRGSQHHAAVCGGQFFLLQALADEQPKQDGVDGVSQ